MAPNKKKRPEVQPALEAHISFAIELSFLLKKQWFDTRFDPPLDHRMACLMFNVFSAAKVGRAVNKKAAVNLFGKADQKTARKYIARAIELGFFDVEKSEQDRRIEHLVPTNLLNELIENEIVRMEPFIAIEHFSKNKKAAVLKVIELAKPGRDFLIADPTKLVALPKKK